MNMKKRLTALFLLLAMALSLVPAAYADGDAFTEITLTVSDGETETDYPCLRTEDGDVWFTAEDLGKISGYSLQEGSGALLFTLGSKYIHIEEETGRMKINVLNHETVVSRPIRVNGTVYLAASELLPWMNVSCAAVDGALEVIPDAASLWVVSKDCFSGSRLFDLNEVSDDNFLSRLGYASMITFDTFLNRRLKKLLHDTNGSNLYDKEVYVDTLLEMASDEVTFLENIGKSVDKVVSFNSTIGTVEEALKIDKDEQKLKVVNFGYQLTDDGVDQDIVNSFSELHENWESARELVSDYSSIKKYLDVFKILKSYELTLRADTDYRKLLEWMVNNPGDDETMNSAVKQAKLRLDETWGVFASYAADTGNTITKTFLKKQAKKKLGEDSVALDMGKYLEISKYFYKYVVDFADAAEGAGKLFTYIDIMYDARSMCFTLETKEMTEENVSLLRQAYLMTLMASRKCYQVLEELFDVKVLFIPLFDAEGVLDYALKPIEESMTGLLLTADNGVHDSVDGKDEMGRELRQCFGELLGTPGIDKADAAGETGRRVEADRAVFRTDNSSLSSLPVYQNIIASTGCLAYALVDLTHNGENELVILTQPDKGWSRYEVTVYNLQGNPFHFDSCGGASDSEYELYLTSYRDEWYFLRRYVGAGTGWFWDSFSVYFLHPEGTERSLYSTDGISYDYEKEMLPQGEWNRYYTDLNRFFARSLLVVNTVGVPDPVTELDSAY